MKLRVLVSEYPDNPYFNLALDEAIFIKSEKVLRIWRNGKSVILGALSKIGDEVNLDFIREHKIPLLRRISGGGTVYHDMGNVNYTLIIKRDNEEELVGIDYLYHKLLRGAVKSIEILTGNSHNVKIYNESDITFLGYKVSGNAGYINSEKYMLHGTVLISVDLSIMHKALIIPPKKVRPEIDLIKYRVNNLSYLINREIGFADVIRALVKGFEEILNAESYFDDLYSEEVRDAEMLAKEKYLNPSFIYRRM